MATPALLQSRAGASGAGVTTFSRQFTSAIANSSSTILVFAGARGTPTATLTVSDDTTAGNYVLDVQSATSGPGFIVCARQSTVTGGSTPTVTVTSSLATTIQVVLWEVSNLQSAPFDQSSSNLNNASVTSQGTGTTAALAGSGEFAAGYVLTNQLVTSFACAGFTLDPNIGNSSVRSMAAYQVTASASGLNAPFTSTGSSPYNSLIATYKQTGLAPASGTGKGLLMGVGS